MPRGKATVYVGLCSVCNDHTTTRRILKRKKADFPELTKFCASCRAGTTVKFKEERHSS